MSLPTDSSSITEAVTSLTSSFIEAVKTSPPSTTTSLNELTITIAPILSTLKSYNRACSLNLLNTAHVLTSAHALATTSSQSLEALKFERSYLLEEIGRLKAFSGSELGRVRKEEGMDPLPNCEGTSGKERQEANLIALSELSVARGKVRTNEMKQQM